MMRLLPVAAVVAAASFALPGLAEAAEPEITQAWTRSAVLPTFVPEEGHLYVAVDAGLESARTFLAVDGDDAASIGELVLVDVGATALGPATVLVCPLTTPLLGEGEVSAERAPEADCEGAPVLEPVAGSLVVPVGASPFGVALVPRTDHAATFHLDLDASRTTVRSASAPATPAPAPEGPQVPAPEPPSSSAVVLPSLDLPAPGLAPVDAAALPSLPVSVATQEQPALLPPAPVPAVGSLVLRTAASPPALAVLLPLAVVSAAVLLLRRRRAAAALAQGVEPRARAGGLGFAALAGAAALVVVPPLFAEVTAYKIGLVLIVVVAATGLHVLVNWAGELSLGHAAMVGFPAFAVAKLSADHGLSPIVLLPVGLAAGAAVGAVVGLPALRARGIQVALVTLAASVAIDRFFFTKPWFVGEAAGAAVSRPTLGPLELRTSRSLYFVLAAVVLLAVAVAWFLHRSKLARGMRWISVNPAAAAAFGIPVNRYRVLAYVVAGCYAGLAGGLTAMWVQRLTPQAFPQSQSFTYLVIVALAGRGFLGGVAIAAALIEGGRLLVSGSDALIAYGAPLGLILSLTSYRQGLNGLLARARRVIVERSEVLQVNGTRIALGLAGIAGVVAAVIGFCSIALAWYHAGNSRDPFVQNQELLSGGVGGLALVIFGSSLLIVDRLAANRSDR